MELRRWVPGEGLSLADRLCLGLGERLDAAVLTADKSWGDTGRIVQIRWLRGPRPGSASNLARSLGIGSVVHVWRALRCQFAAVT